MIKKKLVAEKELDTPAAHRRDGKARDFGDEDERDGLDGEEGDVDFPTSPPPLRSNGSSSAGVVDLRNPEDKKKGDSLDSMNRSVAESTASDVGIGGWLTLNPELGLSQERDVVEGLRKGHEEEPPHWVPVLLEQMESMLEEHEKRVAREVRKGVKSRRRRARSARAPRRRPKSSKLKVLGGVHAYIDPPYRPRKAAWRAATSRPTTTSKSRPPTHPTSHSPRSTALKAWRARLEAAQDSQRFHTPVPRQREEERSREGEGGEEEEGGGEEEVEEVGEGEGDGEGEERVVSHFPSLVSAASTEEHGEEGGEDRMHDHSPTSTAPLHESSHTASSPSPSPPAPSPPPLHFLDKTRELLGKLKEMDEAALKTPQRKERIGKIAAAARHKIAVHNSTVDEHTEQLLRWAEAHAYSDE